MLDSNNRNLIAPRSTSSTDGRLDCKPTESNEHYQQDSRASITLLCPLVGSSLASDWVSFSKSNRLFDNVSPKCGGIQPLSFLYIGNSIICICIIKANEHYQQDSRALHHTVVSTCWQFSCLGFIGSDFRNRTSSSTMYHQNVEVYSHSPSYILVILLCICIIKANEHYQQDSRALHHTVVSTCWQFSCLGLGQIFEIEPAL